MNPLASLQNSMPTFTKKEALIAQLILQDPKLVIQYSAEEIALQAHSSKSAYIRLCQKIGYDGYTTFRFAISRHLVTENGHEGEDDPIKTITTSYSEHILQLHQCIQHTDVKKLASYALKANKIKVFGINRTGSSAHQLRLRMAKIGLDAEAITDSVLMRDAASIMREDDLCIIFSIKAMNFYHPFIKEMREHNCPVVLITMTPKTPMRKDVSQMITLPFISRSSTLSFMDDQAIIFVFIEILLNEIASQSKTDLK